MVTLAALFKDPRMEQITRTVYGSNLQTCQLLGIPFNVVPNTTLNEKFSIAANVTLNPTDMPYMRYLVIGNGGHRMKTTGTGTIQVPEPIQHRSTDAALYNHLPFVLRPAANDLPANVRSRYALRRAESYGGNNYFAYYAKRLDLNAISSVMEYHQIANNTDTVSAFIPSTTHLNPTPPAIPSTGTIVTSGDYVISSAKISAVIDAFDVAEILNACNIIHGSEDFAIISEMGMCSGVEKTVTALDAGGTSFNFAEIVAAQIVSHIASYHALRFSSMGVNNVFDVGATEPLFLPTP